MDVFEQATGQPRGTQFVPIEIKSPDGVLRVDYELPEPYTLDEYMAAHKEAKARYEAGERTEGGASE